MSKILIRDRKSVYNTSLSLFLSRSNNNGRLLGEMERIAPPRKPQCTDVDGWEKWRSGARSLVISGARVSGRASVLVEPSSRPSAPPPPDDVDAN